VAFWTRRVGGAAPQPNPGETATVCTNSFGTISIDVLSGSMMQGGMLSPFAARVLGIFEASAIL
jgi:hypothetical protein